MRSIMSDDCVHWAPKAATPVPRWESSSLATDCSQNAKLSRSRATSLALSSVGASLARAGALAPAMGGHASSLSSATCRTISPKVICAGVGLYEYLSAGISSADATRFFSACAMLRRNASAVGDDWAAPATGRDARARRAKLPAIRIGLLALRGWWCNGVLRTASYCGAQRRVGRGIGRTDGSPTPRIAGDGGPHVCT